MNKRIYGNTGKNVSEIGLGSWQLGNARDWSEMSDEEGVSLINRALELGVNFFDTAPNYGGGRSEEILGKALRGKRDSVVVNTKFGHHPNGQVDFSPEGIRASVEGSLRRLQRDYVDSVLLHNPSSEILEGKTSHFEILEKLKEEGKIGAYGASVDWSEDMFKLMNNTRSQVIEVMFNIFHQEPAKAFERAMEKNIALIVKVPLDSGWLSGKYNSKSSFEDIRSRWSPEVIERRAKLLDLISFVTDERVSMVQAALRYILSHPAVSTVIPGAKNIRQLEENISASDEKMPKEQVQRLVEIWEQNLRDSNIPW